MLLGLLLLSFGATSQRLEADYPAATLHVRPGQHTVSIATGLDAAVPADDASIRAFLRRYGGAFGIGADDTLRLQRVRRNDGGSSWLFQWLRAGTPVDGAAVVATFDAAGRLTTVHVGPQLPTARGAFRLPAPRADADRRWVTAGDALRPAWVMTTTLRDGATSREALDAETGDLLWAHEVRWSARARVFDDSPVRDGARLCPLNGSAAYTTCAQPVWRSVGDVTSLSGPRAVARNCLGANAGTGCLPRAAPNGDGDFDEAPDFTNSTTDRFGEAMGYYHVDRFSAWLDGLSPAFAAAGGLGTVDVFTNVGGYEGAFFLSSGPFGRFGIRVGQDLADWAYDADVLAHELGHGVVERTANLGWYSHDTLGIRADPGALNEGTADYLALSHKGWPQLGENAASRMLEGGGDITTPYLRTVGERRTCQVASIDTSTTLALGGRVGQVHADGVIWGSFLWALRARAASIAPAVDCQGCNAVDVLVMHTLDALGPQASFDDAVLALQQQAASRFGAETGQLVACLRCAWDMPACEGRLRQVYPGETHEALLLDAASAGRFGAVTPAAMQFTIDTPANTAVVFNRFVIESGQLTIVASFGQPVHWAGSGHDATHTITALNQSLPAQPTAGRWYFQPVHDGARLRRFGFRVGFSPGVSGISRPQTPDVACTLGDGVPQGCACTPQCGARACGSDGCQGTCGTCGADEACSPDGQCVCAPRCAGRTCGPDGCGGVCGACGDDQRCSTDGLCEATPPCTGQGCPPDDACADGDCAIDPPPATGCGCDATALPGLGLPLALAALGRRRRRRQM